MYFRLRHWSQHLLAQLPAALPSSCALCGSDSNDAVCDSCRKRHFMRQAHRCIQCAIPLPGDASVCGECLKHPPMFDSTVVAADYAPPIDQLVLALKFGNRLELAPLFAGMLRNAIAQTTLPEYLTAVPLGPKRLVERGFNQALEIARPLSKALAVRIDAEAVIRQRDTHAQAMLHPDERRKNIRHAFLVPAQAIDKVKGRHVGVVDDVMTTGETLNEVAATLKRFGASRVTNFVFARTAHQ